MKKRKFITWIFLLLMVVTGCLSYKSVYAETGKAKFTITLEEGQAIEGDLVLDLYSIADIVWDGTGEKDTTGKKQTSYYLQTAEDSAFKAVFNGLNVGVDKDTQEFRGEIDIDALANSAAGIVFGEDPKTIKAVYPGMALNTEYDLNTGLYLAIIHSGDFEEADYKEYLDVDGSNYTSNAYSYDKTYVFKPLLVFVYGDNASAIDLSKKNEDEVLIKYSIEDRFGQFQIIKFVSVYGGEKTNTTLVYSVKGYDKNDNLVYDKILTLALNKGGEYDPIVLNDIPVGTRVVVTEEYSGASYELISKEGDEQTIVPIDEEKPQIARFTNKYNDIPYSGYGVTNTFTYEEKEVDDQTKGSWTWTNDLPTVGE